MSDPPPGVIPISADEYDRLYPTYLLEAQAGERFQEWFKCYRKQQTRRKVALVRANSIGGEQS